MSKVVIDLSMSVDGYITGPNDNRQQPLGEGGDQLHAWFHFRVAGPTQGGTVETIGAMLTGRRTYDLVDGWGGSPSRH